MRQLFLKTFLSLVVCLFSLVVPANSSTPEMARELLEKSGLEVQIQNIPQMIKTSFVDGINKTGQEFPAGKIAEIADLVGRSFDPELILDYCAEQIAAELSDHDIRSVLTWLNSALGQKITELEEAASTPEGYRAMKAMSAELKNTKHSNVRMGLIQQLDKAMKSTEWQVETVMNMQVAQAAAIMAAAPTIDQIPVEKVRASMEAARPAIEMTLAEEILVGELYTYRSLTDKELKKYIGFAESESGQRYHTVIRKALNDGMIGSSKKMGSAIGRFINGEAEERINREIARPIQPTIGEVYPQRK